MLKNLATPTLPQGHFYFINENMSSTSASVFGLLQVFANQHYANPPTFFMTHAII